MDWKRVKRGDEVKKQKIHTACSKYIHTVLSLKNKELANDNKIIPFSVSFCYV